MKEWKTEKNEFGKECYELHFDQFYGDDEDIIAPRAGKLRHRRER